MSLKFNGFLVLGASRTSYRFTLSSDRAHATSKNITVALIRLLVFCLQTAVQPAVLDQQI